MRRLGLALLALALAGCITSLQRGERLYRDGDRLGALEVWRAAPDDHDEHAAIAKRIAVVEEEFDRLVVRYKKRASYFEGKDRLAESILNYRLALKLRPDPEVLSHVQGLARELNTRKAGIKSTYGEAMMRNDLAAARRDLARLRDLDPFDPELENDQRQLDTALRTEISRLLAAGRAGFSMGNYNAAEKAFRAVLALDPQNETARGHLSYIATTRREGFDVAAFDTGMLASMNDIRAEGFYENGKAAEDAEKFYAAIGYYKRALQANPKHSRAMERLAAIRARLAYRVDQLIELGRSQFRNEDLQLALDLWGKALDIDPDNERAQAYVERAERELQNLEQLRSEPGVSERGLE